MESGNLLKYSPISSQNSASEFGGLSTTNSQYENEDMGSHLSKTKNKLKSILDEFSLIYNLSPKLTQKQIKYLKFQFRKIVKN